MATDLGVAGAAIATVISQFVSVFWCLARLCRTQDIYRVQLSKIRIDGKMLKQVVGISIPSGLQNSIISFGNVIVQSYVNSFGDMAMAGIGAYGKIESLAFVPILAFNLAITTFISQNLGAEKYDRAKKGAKFGITASILSAEVIGILIFVTASQLIAAFDRTPEVIQFGTDKTRTAVLFFLPAFSRAIAFVIQSSGHSMVPMIIMVAS